MTRINHPSFVIADRAPLRDPRYLAWIRTLPCMACMRTPSQAAHYRAGQAGGIGLKPSDDRVTPLCFECHRSQHDVGERRWWRDVGIDPENAINLLRAAYDGGGAMTEALKAYERGEVK